ncbi:putative baseplate assembly protein [Cohnella sp. OV330]|uniref:baseplate J/gp47 family protein n=1 Tax=Cohnella sp. OV330 TaxID=1855288 RepID=UPI0008E44118|nr:baseplate J/gp47 family protein [Cohnella sp. OV330]SFB15934.1 putative baseplate assembly protein [Cohnella sp. OV330]
MKPDATETTGMRLPPPIDGSDVAAFAERFRTMAPHYTPEWRFSPDDPDAGTALFFLAAEMLEENVKRLNRAPLNNFISFLELLGVKLQPARAARATAVFRLADGAYEPVYVPQGTQLTAEAQDGGEDISFETEHALLVTPARLVEWINVHPQRDMIVRASGAYEDEAAAGAAPEIAVFGAEGDDLQRHELYIRHDGLFELNHPARLTLSWFNSAKRYAEPELARGMADTDWLEWSWYDESSGGWRLFDRVTSVRNEVTLWKTTQGRIGNSAVGEAEGRWIRARVKPDRDGLAVSPALARLPEVEQLSLRGEHDLAADPGGIPPALLYSGDLELDATGFFPFGQQFFQYSLFHLACPEAFSKHGSRLTLRFDARWDPWELRMAPDPEVRWRMVMRTADFARKPPQRLYVRRVLWEYWNGESWMRLPGSGRYEELFANLPEEHAGSFALELDCPADWERTFVNGTWDWWLRVRVAAMDTVNQPVVEYMTPHLSRMSLTYAYSSDDRLAPAHAYTLNNAEWTDKTAQLRQGGEPFRPFLPIDCPSPAVYLGFDQAPLKGPIRLSFQLGRQVPANEGAPWIEWEALVRDGLRFAWVPLKGMDTTNGFTESGAFQFAGPPGLEPVRLFGVERVWLRALNRDGRFGNKGALVPTVLRVDRNAVSVVQRRTLRDEYPERTSDGWQLSAAPVVSQEVWVEETGFVGEQTLAEMDEDRYEAHRDSEGRQTRVWIRWQAVETLAGSLPHDRHYTIDEASGRLRFGDGKSGMGLPLAGTDKVRVTYQVTEGARGNVPARAIRGLLQPLAFVDSVGNPSAAVGGGDAESLARAMERGPQHARHRGRAVSASDMEWIVRESDPSIAQVRCLPGRDARLRRAPGKVVVVALPLGGREGVAFFPEIKKKIEAALRDKASNLLLQGGRLTIMPPALLEISVKAIVRTGSADDVVPTEAACLKALDRYLDTRGGQIDGRGWQIGETVHASALYGLLQSERTVLEVELLHMSVVVIEHGEAREVPESALRDLPHGIVVSGSHQVTARLG